MNDDINLLPFFKLLAEAVSPLMSHVKIQNHNVDGCRVRKGKAKGGKQGKIQFAFLAKGDNEVEVEIDLPGLFKNPKEYIDHMLKDIDGALMQMKRHSTIISLPPEKQIVLPSKVV